MLSHLSAAQVWGEMWAAPVLTITDEDVAGEVEKALTEREHQLKKAKKAGPKAKAQPAPAAPGNLVDSEAILIDDDCWSIPSDDEKVVVRGAAAKAPKAAKNRADQDAAVAARKAAREAAAAWKKEVAKAAKCVASLTSVHQSLMVTKPKVDKNLAFFSDDMQQSFETALSNVHSLKQRAPSNIFRTYLLYHFDFCTRSQYCFFLSLWPLFFPMYFNKVRHVRN